MNPPTHPLLDEIRVCRFCEKILPLGPKPVLNFTSSAPILIVGQAPGTRVHNTGIPWNDPSGDRLRHWLQVDRETFYNPNIFAIVPMAFCYPGRGKGGDLPPRPECAQLWMEKILMALPRRQQTILVGLYAQKYFLKDRCRQTLTETVRSWREYFPEYVVLPHPSPRNNIWLKRNPWFEKEVIPAIRSNLQLS